MMHAVVGFSSLDKPMWEIDVMGIMRGILAVQPLAEIALCQAPGAWIVVSYRGESVMI
jgi:hypothetical protein